MKRTLIHRLLIALTALIHALLSPPAPAALLMGFLCPLPILIICRRDAVRANLLAFGDALIIGLPLLMLAAPMTPGASGFAVGMWLSARLTGGWLLRREGLSAEKNFTLILAYRQTLAHCADYPKEPHPTLNPLFEPAREAQLALTELLPPIGLALGWLLHTPDALPHWLRYAGALTAAAVLLLNIRLRHLRAPVAAIVPAILSRMLAAPLICLALMHLTGHISPPLLLLAAAPPRSGLPDELKRANADSVPVSDIETAVQWCRLLWLLLFLIYWLNL